jgi:UMF1 family MFS transporter
LPAALPADPVPRKTAGFALPGRGTIRAETQGVVLVSEAGSISSAGGVAPAARAPASALAQFCWAVFDGARSPYNVFINIFVFSAYFSTVVIPDPVRGQTWWSYITAGASILIAITSPVLGAIADAGGRRKPWLVAALAIGIPSMAVLWFATPGMTSGIWVIVVGLIGGVMFWEYSGIFLNAMLPNLAAPARIGFLSGAGLALANVFGIALFLFFLYAWSWNPEPLFGLDPAQHEPERAVGIVAAICVAIFSLPLFFFTPDSPSTSLSAREAVSRGIDKLIYTLKEVRRFRNVATFLIARLAFYEGFLSLMLFTGVFAAGILKWTPTMLIVEGLINSVVAAIAGAFAGWLDTRIGSKYSTIIFVAGCLVANVILLSVAPGVVFFMPVDVAATSTGGLFPTLPDKVFLVTQCSIAFFITGGLVTGRALMGKIAPRTMLNEFFGLYTMSGTATAFIGPLITGFLTWLFGVQRVGVGVGIVFLLIGFIVMFRVKEVPTEG